MLTQHVALQKNSTKTQIFIFTDLSIIAVLKSCFNHFFNTPKKFYPLGFFYCVFVFLFSRKYTLSIYLGLREGKNITYKLKESLSCRCSNLTPFQS